MMTLQSLANFSKFTNVDVVPLNKVDSKMLCPVSVTVVQSVPVPISCGFLRLVLCPCLASNSPGTGSHDCSDQQVLQSSLHLPHTVLLCKYVLNVNEN